ncbi:hypothetical protein DTO164E3_6413 [Paecilomyces variotii]|nr:hypothetical protein DTO164E3_6413 [Paecilomyces variotii]
MGDSSAPSPSPPRRFLPQPVETSSTSSRSPAVHRPAEHDNRPAAGTTSGTTTSSSSSQQHVRRFFPQPVETTSRSSKASSPADPSNNQGASSAQPEASAPRRRFLPQPIETETRSSKQPRDQSGARSRGSSGASTSSNRPVRRFAPEPIETVRATNRKSAPGRSNTLRLTSDTRGSTSSGSISPLRKFTPQLIETGKRSVRRSDTIALERRPSDNIFERPDPSESRFSYASLLRRQEGGGRRHSFRVPDLPAIPSNSGESSDSDTPSLSTSPTTSTEESRRPSRLSDERRESCDERVSGYLLSLAARSAEKQLQETALAAFPNEQVYHPVSHFAIDREEDESTVSEEEVVDVVLRDMKSDLSAFRRESTTDLPFEIEELRRFKEEAQKKDNKKDYHHQYHRPKETNAAESKFSAAAIAARRAQPAVSPNFLREWQKEKDAQTKRVSPPMLGADLVFPQSLSPQSTRCDVDHPPVDRHTRATQGCTTCGGLWCTSSHTDDSRGSGLWMGTCSKRKVSGMESSSPNIPGIQTPAVGPDGKRYLSVNMGLASSLPSHLPTTPKVVDPNLADMQRRLSVEEEIEREFHDGFVTQVYNYLSLGYPCTARYFDGELSKISGIPVQDLRQDDQHTDAKGYVGAPEGNCPDADGVTGGKCMRWTALRLYIREWARQQPRMSGNDHLEAWGVRERRGSWAV